MLYHPCIHLLSRHHITTATTYHPLKWRCQTGVTEQTPPLLTPVNNFFYLCYFDFFCSIFDNTLYLCSTTVKTNYVLICFYAPPL